MQTYGFNKSILINNPVGLSVKVYKLSLKIGFPREKMNGIFTSGNWLMHSILLWYCCSVHLQQYLSASLKIATGKIKKRKSITNQYFMSNTDLFGE